MSGRTVTGPIYRSPRAFSLPAASPAVRPCAAGTATDRPWFGRGAAVVLCWCGGDAAVQRAAVLWSRGVSPSRFSHCLLDCAKNGLQKKGNRFRPQFGHIAAPMSTSR